MFQMFCVSNGLKALKQKKKRKKEQERVARQWDRQVHHVYLAGIEQSNELINNWGQ